MSNEFNYVLAYDVDENCVGVYPKSKLSSKLIEVEDSVDLITRHKYGRVHFWSGRKYRTIPENQWADMADMGGKFNLRKYQPRIHWVSESVSVVWDRLIEQKDMNREILIEERLELVKHMLTSDGEVIQRKSGSEWVDTDASLILNLSVEMRLKPKTPASRSGVDYTEDGAID